MYRLKNFPTFWQLNEAEEIPDVIHGRIPFRQCSITAYTRSEKKRILIY